MIKQTENTKFTVGQTVATRSICDYDCIFTAEVIKRTAKTVTIRMYGREEKRCKIQLNDDGVEYIYPHGRYSMAAIFKANREAE